MLGLNNSIVSSGLSKIYENPYSISFDGTDDYINTNQTFQSTFRASFTIAFWLRTNASGLTYLGSKATNNELKVYDQGGKLSIHFEANGDPVTVNSNSEILSSGTGSEWWHIAIVVTKVSTGVDPTTVVMYKNGDLFELDTPTGALTGANQGSFATSDNLVIGALNEGGSITNKSAILGIDEFAIWNSALSAGAIDSIYNAGTPNSLGEEIGKYAAQDDLQVYYTFNDGSTASDYQDSGTNGTLRGSPAFRVNAP